MPWLIVNQTRLCRFKAVPTPVFALEVQRGLIPGQPGAYRMLSSLLTAGFRLALVFFLVLGARRKPAVSRLGSIRVMVFWRITPLCMLDAQTPALCHQTVIFLANCLGELLSVR